MDPPAIPVSATFLEFLNSGQFGGIGIGQSLHECRQRLGQELNRWPFGDDPGSFTARWADLPAELTFSGELLWSMTLDLDGGGRASLFGPHTDFSPAGIEGYLRQRSISFRVRQGSLSGADLEFVLPHAISFLFYSGDDGLAPSLEYIDQSDSLLPFALISRL